MKFRTLGMAALVLAAAFALQAQEIELGFPAHASEWRFTSPGNSATLAQVDWLGKKCLLFETFFTSKMFFTEIYYTKPLTVNSLKEVKVEVYSENLKELIIRYRDATGQTFQYRYALKPGEEWQTISCRFDNHRFPNGQHFSVWGGAKDRKFHFPLKRIEIGFDCPRGNFVNNKTVDLVKTYLGKVTIVTKE